MKFSISRYVNLLQGLFRAYRLNFWVLRGKEKHSGCEIRLFYAGHNQYEYFKQMIFQGDVIEEVVGKEWIWQTKKKSQQYNCDLSVVETDKSLSNSSKETGVFYLPSWFDAIIEFSDAEKKVQTSKNVKEDIKRIKKHELSYIITKDKELFDHFYHNMYVPNVRRAYKEASLLMSHQNMMNRRKNSELLLVVKDGEYISGSILLYENNEVEGWKHGVKDGDVQYMKYGAAAALYYFEIDHLKNSQFQEINHGGTRPFLKDGVFQVKKKWGMQIGKSWPNGFVVSVSKLSKGTKQVLKQNPFIYSHGTDIYGAIFIDKDTPLADKDIKRLHKDYFVPGISKLNLFKLDIFPEEILIPSEFIDTIKVMETTKFI